MIDVISDWVDEWFGDECPPWTWPLAIGGPMVGAAVAILFLS
jgi:hypothetical protein